MATNKLVKQFQRELKANRKQALILLGLAAVAAWFWAPLIFKGGSAAAVVPPPTPTPPTTTVTTNAAVKPGATNPVSTRWQDLSRWIEADPAMSPFAAVDDLRDPFTKPAGQVAAAATTEPADEPEYDLTPADAGLSLRSTMITGSRSGGKINGQMYYLGEKVPGRGGATFELVEVKPTHVTLTRNNKSYELKIRRGLTATRSSVGQSTP